MSEIERAIDDFNNYVEMGYGQYFRPSSESTELALTALKEKLEREKNPMTCEGCEWQLKMIGVTRCNRCRRFPLLTDRYEPKGETPCTKD